MSPYQFGDRVLVLARTARIIASANGDGALVFRQSTPPRDHGRVVVEDVGTCATWPGAALPVEWVDGPDGFVLEPADPGKGAFVRLRRMIQAVPTVGVVVGSTWKQEGTLREGLRAAELGGPGRRIDLYEVAIPSRSRAQLVMAHPKDLEPLP